MEIQKITLNCVNIVAPPPPPPGVQQYLLYSGERKLKYSLGYHRLTRYSQVTSFFDQEQVDKRWLEL